MYTVREASFHFGYMDCFLWLLLLWQHMPPSVIIQVGPWIFGTNILSCLRPIVTFHFIDLGQGQGHLTHGPMVQMKEI